MTQVKENPLRTSISIGTKGLVAIEGKLYRVTEKDEKEFDRILNSEDFNDDKEALHSALAFIETNYDPLAHVSQYNY